jgi:RNA polymerase sigma factor (sigma-70 family)
MESNLEDSTLLRRYAEEKSEEAFAALVRRHLDLVYAVALRQVGGDAHLAQDVAQTVFTALARKARELAARPVLGGWLYRTTQFTAIDVVRTESRRRARETEASTMHDSAIYSGGAIDWDKLRPTLDHVIGELSDDDRDAVVLRFFEGKSFADVGARLRLTENAARMRVERALDKLHGLLARRGVTSTTAALAVVLANQPSVAAPFGLAGIVTGAALGGAGAAGSLWTFMLTSKLVLGSLAGAAALAVGTAVYQTQQVHQRDAALAGVTTEQHALLAKLHDLETRMAAATKRAQAIDEDNAKLLKVVEGLKAARAAKTAEGAAPITQDVVDARYKHAQELARNGDTAGALKEFLWCFDDGMPRLAYYTGVRRSFLLSQLVKLADTDPSAMAALRERRDAAEKRLLASKSDYDAAADFSSINHYLKEDAQSLRIFDQLAPDDQRRRSLGLNVYDLLVDAGRYQDAAATRSFGEMSAQFERSIEERSLPVSITDPSRIQSISKAQRDYAVTNAVTSIEVLAGSGDLAHAQTLATRLLAYDGSAETKALLQQHLARAGHPDLLASRPKS